MHHHEEDYSIGRRGAVVSICVNVFLFLFKIFAGVAGRSHAMIADALHTASDFLTSIGVFIGFKLAQKPADAEHPYGHGKAESVAAKLVSIILIFGGLKVALDSVRTIIAGDLSVPHQIAFWAAVISIAIKEGLYRYAHALACDIQSVSLEADAWHHRSDALSSVAALIGIGGARLGYPILDPIAGFGVSLFVVHIGLRLFHTAYDELMDAALPESLLEKIRSISSRVEGVKRIKDIKGRKLGIDIFVDLTIEVDKTMSVEDAHLITMKVRRDILRDLRGAKDIIIHVEPYQ